MKLCSPVKNLWMKNMVHLTQTMTTLSMRNFGKVSNPLVYVPQNALDQKFVRSSGPGGQNVNKVNTKVELRFNVDDAEWLPDDVKTRLIHNSGYLTQDHDLIVTSGKFRTQEQNLSDAYKKLTSKVNEYAIAPKERAPTKYKETKEMKEKRVDFKRKRAKIKSMRGKNNVPRSEMF